MAGRVAPYIDNTGLVFAYDQANIVRSYLGEPTVNLATNTPSQGGWPGSYTVVDSANKTFDFTTSTVEWGGDASWTTFYYDVSAYTGQYVTISATFEYASDPNKFNFLWIGQTSGSETYLGYSPEADRNVKTTDDREDITWSGVVGSGGKVGILIWMSNGTSTTVTARISNVQVEVKSHATPFVNGTRSVTQGLKDLTGRSTIDLSNVSFDSSAQMTFDGSDDRILTSENIALNGSQTFEVITTISGGPQSPAGIISNHDYANTSNFGLNHISGNRIGISIGYTDNSREYDSKYTTYTATVGTPFHLVMTFDQSSNTVKLYINGVLDSTFVLTKTVKFTSRPVVLGRWDYQYNYYYFNGKIPVAKAYNRALSAADVTQNFNAVRGRYGI
jgi:hypothetical protein